MRDTQHPHAGQWRGRLARILAAVVLTLGGTAGVVGIAAPAQAGAEACPSGNLCYWSDGKLGGYMDVIFWNDDCFAGDTRDGSPGITMNDTISSTRNRSGVGFRLFEHCWRGGSQALVPSGYQWNLAGNWWNDRISGHCSGYFGWCP